MGVALGPQESFAQFFESTVISMKEFRDEDNPRVG
jgi:hypothetical protein